MKWQGGKRMDYTYIYKDKQLTIEQEVQRMNDEIVDLLIFYRKKLNMTQKDIADATGIHEDDIARIERKESITPIERLKKYARCIGRDLRVEFFVPDGRIYKLPLPVGCSDFRKVSTEFCYVDKTLLIKDVLDENTNVSLFTRPRRFGKTLNMDMLRVFFEKTDEDTSTYFADKKIWKCGKKYRAHQGKYPVVFLTFKDVKFKTWAECVAYLKYIFALEFNRHSELFDSDRCSIFEKKYFSKIASAESSEIDLTQALIILSNMLHKHHQKEAIIIIDEYDTPINSGYMQGYYDQAVTFMRSLFSGGFKDNPHLKYGFMTGILRVAKESIFSGLNNLKVNSVLDARYSRHFGFTPEEVRRMAEYYGVPEKFDEICRWYDGYRFGQTDIFNPWSVLGYFNDNCKPQPFWVSTGSNDIIGEILAGASDDTKEQLRKLLEGQSVRTTIDTSVIYPSIKDNPSSIYSFLLVAGYLKIVETQRFFEDEYIYKVAIPNLELHSIYKKEILSKLSDVIPPSSVMAIREAICEQDAEQLQEQLRKLLLQTISYNDAASESFYHGLVLGLCAMLDDGYYVTSNRESGEGRFDIQLMPRREDLPGILIEVKSEKNCSEDALKKLAKAALEQIDERNYDADMKMHEVHEIIKYGVAFCGKHVKVAVK